MRIQQSSRQGCVVLTLAGRLDLTAAPQVQRVILKQLAQQPPAIICDLAQVEADTLVRRGVVHHLAMYPSLDQALANARARPPRLRARLTLGPVPTAAAAGRQFVVEVCGHWGLQVLAEPAALLASELVTNAVVHAHTDGTNRGLGLQIVDQVAKAWGVRNDGARGKTVWCTLDLSPPQADTVDRSRESRAIACPTR